MKALENNNQQLYEYWNTFCKWAKIIDQKIENQIFKISKDPFATDYCMNVFRMMPLLAFPVYVPLEIISIVALKAKPELLDNKSRYVVLHTVANSCFIKAYCHLKSLSPTDNLLPIGLISAGMTAMYLSRSLEKEVSSKGLNNESLSPQVTLSTQHSKVKETMNLPATQESSISGSTSKSALGTRSPLPGSTTNSIPSNAEN